MTEVSENTNEQVYIVNEKEFQIPPEIIYRQYYRLISILREAGLDIGGIISGDDSGSLKVNRDVSEVTIKPAGLLNKLFTANKLPEFFATILVPKGEKIWKEKYIDDNLELMQDIGDATALEVLKYFLAGRVNLTIDIINYFLTFIQKNETLNQKLNLFNQNSEKASLKN